MLGDRPPAMNRDVNAPNGPDLLKVDNLTKIFPAGSSLHLRSRGLVQAVSDVSFSMRSGETLGLVGESGCGKSTTGRMILRLIEPTAGRIVFDGKDLTGLNQQQMRPLRRRLQIVFQDPYSSLNPRLTCWDLVTEPLRVHGLYDERAQAHVAQLLDTVGLLSEQFQRYPSEFSGGQRQRIAIARALAPGPQLLVLDEPVSSLDVSVQAQIVTLLQDLQDEFGLTYLFISHDLAVVHHLAHHVAVMYMGKIVEAGTKEQVYASPTHPYTQALLSAVPVADPARRGARERILLTGDMPSATAPPSGCRFRTRCWKAQAICAELEPELTNRVPSAGRSACHFASTDGTIRPRVVPMN